MCEANHAEMLEAIFSAHANESRRCANALERIADALEKSDKRNEDLLEEFRPFLNFGKRKLLDEIAQEYLKMAE